MRFILMLLTGWIISGYSIANPQLGLPPLNLPNNNQQTAEKIALGKQLFNDQRFSADGSISCASCHQDDKAFTDNLPVAKGLNGQTGNRNTPSVINAAFYDNLFWDGRANSLEQQALGPLINPIEHGLKNHQALLEVVQHDTQYTDQFSNVFAVSAREISMQQVTQAIASYERTLIAGDSSFDRYLFGRNHNALSASAERGLSIFKNKAHCVVCHEISWNNALLTDNRFYNIGIGSERLTQVLAGFLAGINRGDTPDKLSLTPAQQAELGRFNVTHVLADIGKFRTPTLRNVALTAPYMHDGSLTTLMEVIDYYDKGGHSNRFIDSKIFPLHLTQQEKTDLLAFMQSLTSQHLLAH